MDSVMADIDYAIANLDASRQITTITKWTALALKSRIALFEGTFRKLPSGIQPAECRQIPRRMCLRFGGSDEEQRLHDLQSHTRHQLT